MENELFYQLFADALTVSDRDAYVSDWATSSQFDPDKDGAGPDFDALVPMLGNLWDVANMTVASIRSHSGLTQIAFAERFCIPRRTVENWESRGSCPAYVRLMMAEALGILTVPRV